MSTDLVTVTINRSGATDCAKSTLSIVETFTDKFIEAFSMLCEVGEDRMEIEAIEDPLAGNFIIKVSLVGEDVPDQDPLPENIKQSIVGEYAATAVPASDDPEQTFNVFSNGDVEES